MAHDLMQLSLKPGHLRRYRDLALLLFKYGDDALVRSAGLEAALEDVEAEERKTGARPEELARDLERMGPTFVKLGQLLSTRPDILPPPYLDALARLQDKVEPFGYEKVEEIVTRELGVRVSKAFASFEERPLAAASLGQVHRATLRDGRAVAVKVQRPGIRDTVRQDMEALEEIAGVADGHTELGRRYSFTTVLSEFRKALLAELDYQAEAENLETLGDSLAEFERLIVPRPVHGYTTTRVLTMDLIRGRNVAAVSPLARMEMDGSELLDELFRAYLRQALVDGLLHADPHPGNVFLTDDGRLALLDVGMVLRIPDRMRERLLHMLIAISEGDGEEVAAICERLGEPTPHFHRRAFERDVARLVSRAARPGPGGDNPMGRSILALARVAGDNGLHPPGELSLIGKTLLNLDQIAGLLDPEFDPQEAVRRNAVSLTQRRLLGALTPGHALGAALDAKEFAQDLPRRVNRVLDAIGESQLEVKVRITDQARLLTSFQQMANRVTTGLVLAALIVGASLLMHVETNFTVLGYPVLAIVFFLGAAAGGVGLMWRIWVGDRRMRREAEKG